MPPMRIALIASNRFPIRQPFAGGLEAHVWHLARALAHAGHQVSLFAAPDSDPSLDCAALQVRYLELSAAASTDPSMPGTAFMADHHAYLTLMLRLARHGTDEFDVIHNHSLHHLPVAMAPTLATPMLCTLHTPPTPWLESAISATAGAGARFAAVSSYTARSWQHLLPDVDRRPQRRRRPALAPGPRRIRLGLVRQDHPGEGAAPGHRRGAPRRSPAGYRRTGVGPRLLRPRCRTPAGRRGPLRRAPRAPRAGSPRRSFGRGVGHSTVGRTLRAGSRRGHDVRHARRGLRPWRHSRDRRPRRGAASADRRRRRHGRGDPGRAHAVPACRAHAGRTTLFGSRHGRRLPRHLPRHDRRHRTDRL